MIIPPEAHSELFQFIILYGALSGFSAALLFFMIIIFIKYLLKK